MGILAEIFKQAIKKPATNVWPVKYAPPTSALMAIKDGKLTLDELAKLPGNDPPVKVPDGFRGRVLYYKDRCIGCKSCLKVCPSKAIEFIPDEKKIKIYVARCTFCQMCVDICPPKVQALAVSHGPYDFLMAEVDQYASNLITTQDPDPDPDRPKAGKKTPAAKKPAPKVKAAEPAGEAAKEQKAERED